ncbi:hypothetical protein EJ110_NYTH56595 [Nymphaea thermarum]|nr:hypothetical protein EJ110_NYTH56595 [Nymphaea thermarum]
MIGGGFGKEDDERSLIGRRVMRMVVINKSFGAEELQSTPPLEYQCLPLVPAAFLILFIVQQWTGALGARDAYVVHMDVAAMPTAFSSHHYWYTALLSSESFIAAADDAVCFAVEPHLHLQPCHQWLQRSSLQISARNVVSGVRFHVGFKHSSTYFSAVI